MIALMNKKRLDLRKPPLLLLTAGFTTLLAGCSTVPLALHLRAASCINPMIGPCPDPESRILKFYVYQLKTEAPLSQLTWEEMSQEKGGLEKLKGSVTDEQHGSKVWTWFIDRNEQRTEKVRRLAATSHLLVVSAGRREGSQSIAQIALRPGQRQVQLCFKGNDVFIEPGCEKRLEDWQ